jgi:mannose-6-phosphate isomerase-like protein (cupin superfamily)
MSTNIENWPYATFLDIKFPPLEVVDVPAVVGAVRDQWFNQTLCKVNDSVLRLGVMQGEYHWHKHDDDDELFFVLEGRFFVDLEDRVVQLDKWQGFTVPKGVLHRTRAPERAVILMMETASIVPTGDA